MRMMLSHRLTVFGLLLCAGMLIGAADHAVAQKKTATLREFLLQYKGKEVLIQDKTGGVEQFVGGDAAKAYNLVLNDVMNDYMIVSRNTDTDKRSFVYPLSVIRRIIYLYDGKPYQKIVIELY